MSQIEFTFAFFMIHMGPISFYLGPKVQHNKQNQTIKLLKPAYINKALNKFYLDKIYTVNILMKKIALFEQKIKKEILPSKKKCFQGITGSFMCSMVETRPNITFAIFVTSCFLKNPGLQHTKAVKTILQYLKGSNKREITYSGQNKLLVEGYSDFD